MFSILIYFIVMIISTFTIMVGVEMRSGADVQALTIKRNSLLLDEPAKIYADIFPDISFTIDDMILKGIIDKKPQDLNILYKKVGGRIIRVCEDLPVDINLRYYLYYNKYPYSSKINISECPAQYETYRDISIL